MILEALYDRLTADATIDSLTNGIWPFIIPQGKDVPAITYRLSSDERTRNLSGLQSGYKTVIVDIDCYASSYLAASNIADAIESSLVDFTGQMGTTSPAVMVDHMRLERRGPDLFENDTERYRVPLQFFIGYEV